MATQQQQVMLTPVVIATVACTVAVVAGVVWRLLRGKKSAAMDPTEFRPYTLVSKTELTHGVPCPVVKFRFALPHPTDTLPLPTGQHISLRCLNPENGKVAMRSYTPTSSPEDVGFFDLVVKIYPKGVMGQYLNHLEVGKGTVDARGPKGRFTYTPGTYTHIGMLAGGSGITPMYQIMSKIAKNASTDPTKVSLIYGNVTVEDIILRNEIEAMASQHPSQMSVYHVLNKPPEQWNQGTGFITADMIKERLPPPSQPKIIVLLCGPTPMISALTGHLTALGYTNDQIFTF
eukprot:RCo008238